MSRQSTRASFNPEDRMFTGHTAVISGGLGDIGRAIALAFAECGASVSICDIHENSEAKSLLMELESHQVRAQYDQVDVTDAASMRSWLSQVESRLSLPTLIVPNAAIVQPLSLDKLDAVTWRRELAVNLDGAFYLAHAAAQRLVQLNRSGRIVFVGSWAAHRVHRHVPTYCVSKAGLRMLCQCMAAEYAPHGILVNEVAPGYVDAGLSAQLYRQEPARREANMARVPVGSLIEPQEVATQVIHLCNLENRHMVGSTILMDGGLSLLQ